MGVKMARNRNVNFTPRTAFLPLFCKGIKSKRCEVMAAYPAARLSTSSAHWFRLLPDSSAAKAALR